ncbi:MAG TPA: hypothetical protein VJW76_13265, partial [Verrucomicrobiae bacterium]|nr:hypothetical protein [Verrucomicrobiae bacterium]
EELGIENDILLEVGATLKIKYYLSTPKTPPYLKGQGPVVPLEKLRGVLPNETMQKVLVGKYSYCNLAPDMWSKLRNRGVAKCVVVWGRPRNTTGRRPVIVADLKTDVFNQLLMGGDEFRRSLLEMERVLRQETGDDSVSLFNELERNR